MCCSYMLWHCWTHLLSSVLTLGSFCAWLGMFYVANFPMNLTVLFLPFQSVCVFSFVLPYCISTLMRNRNVKKGYFCLVPDLAVKAFSLLPLRMMLVASFSLLLFSFLMSFIRLKLSLSISELWIVFIINGSWILSNASVSFAIAL